MKVLLINSVCGIGSTGRICTDLAAEFEGQGHEVKIAYGRLAAPECFRRLGVQIGTKVDLFCHALKTRVFNAHGFGSVVATKRFLKWAEEYDPDLLWLHNIHGYYINIELLFDWIKQRPNMQVKWTLHDCWSFTGHCCYFTTSKCDKWLCVCEQCPQKKSYPASYVCDNSRKNFQRKMNAFTGVKNMQIITPSQWLADLVKVSFLKEYSVEVCYNRIDTNVFKPTPSDFREKYGLQDKKIILGVASVWEKRKGLSDFLHLAKMIDDHTVIVLVGLTEKQMRNLPGNIIAIKKTNSPQALAEIYTASDVLFNPIYEDNYPTVNLEAQACGTKVVTYDTGGAKETLYMGNAVAIETGDLASAIQQLLGQK